MAYLRFVVSNDHPDTGVPEGLFGAAYALRDTSELSRSDRDSLDEQLAWFGKHLPIPTRFNRSSSKGYQRRKTKGIAWLRDSAVEHISRMRELQRVLEAYGYVVNVVQEERVGYIVYSDEFQLIAEPFADTRTSE